MKQNKETITAAKVRAPPSDRADRPPPEMNQSRFHDPNAHRPALPIESPQRENKMLIAQLAEQAVSNVDKPKPEQLGPENNEELFRLQSFSKDLKAKYDHFKQEAVRKTRELEQKLDKLKDLEAEGHTHEEDDTPVMSTIRQLENRFDKALIKYNEAASIGKTYEQIVRRHGEEKMDFDRQLALIERALKQKEKDLVQLTLMSHDAIAAKEMAKSELLRVEKEEAAERAKRNKELKDRRDIVRQREDINAQLAARAAQREADAQRAEEARKHKALMSDKASKEDYERAKKEKQDRMRAYENAFFKIKEATGVSDISSVMDKFMTQEDTNINLKLLTTEGQAKLDALQAAMKEARTALEEYRFSGGGGGGGRRIVDEYESSLVDGINNNERVRAKFEKVHRVLVSMKSGTEHLMDKLDVVDGGVAQPPDVVSDETVVEVLAACEQKLIKALQEVGDAAKTALLALDDGAAAATKTISKHNVRVDMSLEYGGSDSDGEEDEEGADEVPDRDRVKVSANELAEKLAKRKKGGRGGTPLDGQGSKGSRPSMA